MMNVKPGKIVLELNEHDALRLLNLILRKSHQDHKPWRPYWKYLAEKVKQSIEEAGNCAIQAAERADTPQSVKISIKPDQPVEISS